MSSVRLEYGGVGEQFFRSGLGVPTVALLSRLFVGSPAQGQDPEQESGQEPNQDKDQEQGQGPDQEKQQDQEQEQEKDKDQEHNQDQGPRQDRSRSTCKEKTLSCLNQTVEGSSLHLNLGCSTFRCATHPSLFVWGRGENAFFREWFRGPYRGSR